LQAFCGMEKERELMLYSSGHRVISILKR